MKVTYSTGRGNKIHINIDGEYRFTTDVDFWLSLGIHSGDEISTQELLELEEKIGVRKAYNKGIELLSRRAHSKKELLNKIKRAVDEKYAIIAVDALEEKGYVNDEEFARTYYSYLLNKKHFGKKRIDYEMCQKGISRDITDNLALEFFSDPSDNIREIIERKYSDKLGDEKSKRRVFNSLVRMGYNYSDIRKVMNEYSED